MNAHIEERSQTRICTDAVGVFSLESDDAKFVFALSIFGDGGNHVPLDLGPALAVAAGLTYTCNGVKVRVNLADMQQLCQCVHMEKRALVDLTRRISRKRYGLWDLQDTEHNLCEFEKLENGSYKRRRLS